MGFGAQSRVLEMVPRVPFEISDQVIGCLNPMIDVDRSTLLSCALVCRQWLPASRHQLSERISLWGTAPYVRFINHVLHSDTIHRFLQYTKEVLLFYPDYDGSSNYRHAGRSTTQAASDSSSLFRLFLVYTASHMPKLETLNIQFADWRYTLPLAQEPFLFLKFPVLTDLSLRNCSLPSLHFLRCMLKSLPQLQTLSLSAVRFKTSPVPLSGSVAIQLSLKLHPTSANASAVVQPITTRPSLRALKSLLLHDDPDDPCGLDPLLTWLGRTALACSHARHLSWRPYSGIYSTPPKQWYLTHRHVELLHATAQYITHISYEPSAIMNFPMSAFTNLDTLQIVLPMDNPYVGWERICTSLAQVTACIRHMEIACLYTIELAKIQRDKRSPGLMYPVALDDEFGRVGTVLAGDSYRCLQDLKIDLRVTRKQERGQQEGITVMIERMLPELLARETVELFIQFSCWEEDNKRTDTFDGENEDSPSFGDIVGDCCLGPESYQVECDRAPGTPISSFGQEESC